MTTNLDAKKFLVTTAAAVLLAACSGAASLHATATAPTTGTSTASGTPAIPVVTGAAGTAGADQNDPVCGLVTKDDVATAVGFSIATAIGAGGTCIFQNVDPSLVVALQLINGQSNMSLYLSTEEGSEHIAGLGDDAFWQGAPATFFVRKGDQALVLNVQPWVMTSDPATDHAHRDSLVTLARIALANL